MGVLGTTREDYADEAYEVFPENWTAVMTFSDLMTQWRIGFAGPTGLDYNVLPIVCRARSIPRSKWSELLSSIQIMEDESMRVFKHRSSNSLN
jgi:hypothetical protein